VFQYEIVSTSPEIVFCFSVMLTSLKSAKIIRALRFVPCCTLLLLFLFTLGTGPRRSLSLKLSDTRVYAPQIRARPMLHHSRHTTPTVRIRTYPPHPSMSVPTISARLPPPPSTRGNAPSNQVNQQHDISQALPSRLPTHITPLLHVTLGRPHLVSLSNLPLVFGKMG